MAPFFGFDAYIIEELFLYEKFTQWVIRKIRRFPLNQEHSTNFYIFMNNSGKCRFNHEDIFKCANSRLGWYRRGGLDVVNFILSPTVLGNKIGDRPGLVHPLDYYLKSL